MPPSRDGARPAASSASSIPIAPYHITYLSLVLLPVTFFTFLSIFSQSHAYNVYLSAAPGSALEEAGRLNGLQPIKSFFAQKSNPINVYFIKYAWAWTTLAWLAQLWTLRSPTAPDLKGKGKARDDDADEDEVTPADQEATIASPLAKSLLRYIISTLCWISFAMWLFGPSLMERILTFSGGVCLPHQEMGAFSNPSGDATPVGTSGFRMPEMRIDEAFCRAGRKGISMEEKPELFRTAHRIVTDAVGGAGGGRLRGKWRGGHDISGHVFILSLSTLFLLEEVSPYLPYFISTYLPQSVSQPLNSYIFPQSRARTRTRNPYLGSQSTANTAATVAILALVSLWIFSLVNTSLFFHTPLEKASGALMAILAWVALPKGG